VAVTDEWGSIHEKENGTGDGARRLYEELHAPYVIAPVCRL
jgi:hypothetical protein